MPPTMADTHTETLLSALSKLGAPPVASDTIGLKQQQEAAEAILRSEDVVEPVAVAGQFGPLDIPRLDLGPVEVRPESAGVQWQWVESIVRILNAMHQSLGQYVLFFLFFLCGGVVCMWFVCVGV
eukprot:comp18716_c0_seq2/m.20467 comp18716_c0_seq2/g.20467  ORF comp18716_c0_seq2/g.20467 comp18716_c0_seq2/m.20467 type:complete len:125 (-) comp18716_c0_seq2:27-401(-)